ncbi:MAG: helix-hairpin-helix domain-containing protein, partial [Salinivenus sp.]
GALSYRSTHLRAGLTGYQSGFDRPLRPGAQPYRRFDVSGTQTSMASAYASAHLGPYVVFGEAARSDRGAVGMVGGVGLDHPAGVEAVLLARRYPRDFDGLFSGAFGGGSTPQNEHGIYAGLRLQVASNWWISGYIDQYRSPWLQFGTPQPTSGLDTRLVVETDLRPWLSTYLQVRADRDAEGTVRPGPHGRPLRTVQRTWRHSARWHLEYEFSDRLSLRSRLAATRTGSSTGVLFYQGIGLRLHPDLEVDARVAVFDTDGYKSRLYAYERDLLYSFSVPVFFDKGQRSYLLLQYTPTPSFSIRAKYGVTWYPHRDSIGSGLNATDGNRKRDARLQLRWEL